MATRMNADDIKITGVIPAYNCEKYIARAIDSVLKQTHPVDEIIIVDDGSTDGTAEVIKHYGNKIHYIYQDNTGVSTARNAGIEMAAGNWIAFLDADDEWFPDRIKLQVDLLDRHPDMVWVSGNYTRCVCEENVERCHVSDSAIKNALKGREYFQSFFEAYAKGIWGCTDTMLIKKCVLKEAGLFQVGQHQMEDIDLWWKIARKYPQMGYVAKSISIYHLGVPGSLIQSQTDYSGCRKMIRRHLSEAQNTPYADSVKMCSAMMLKRWMRSMLFDKQTEEIQKMLTEFGELFSSGYKRIMRLLIFNPALTARGLRLISRIVRFLKIRQQLTRKPKKL